MSKAEDHTPENDGNPIHSTVFEVKQMFMQLGVAYDWYDTNQ